jgi:regulator of sigma E protease
MITILAVIFVFGLLIIGHEFGHFIVAKLSNIKVLEFSFGMGPRILKFGKKEKVYSWRAFPVGGFVKMLGEEEQVDDPRSFSKKPTLARMAVIAAGPIMNVVLSVLIFAVIAMVSGYAKPVIQSIAAPPQGETNIVYPSKAVGLQPGDRIISANGEGILTYEDFKLFMYQNGGKPFKLVVERSGSKVSYDITPVHSKVYDMYMVGIDPVFGKASLFEGVQYGLSNTWSLTKQIFGFFSGLISGKASTNDVSGPVGIIKYAGDAARQGFDSLLVFTALLSVNLAVMNLLPFPALDGGWLLILIIEGIRRKKLDADKVGMINFVGFALLMILIVLVTFKDVINLNIF